MMCSAPVGTTVVMSPVRTGRAPGRLGRGWRSVRLLLQLGEVLRGVGLEVFLAALAAEEEGLAIDHLLDRDAHAALAEVVAADRAGHLGEGDGLVLGGELLD